MNSIDRSRRFDGPSATAARVACLLAALGLAGCAGAGTVSIAQTAANGASLAVTGKTIQDHGLSTIMGKDCRVMRLLENEAVCLPEDVASSEAVIAGGDAEVARTALGAIYAGVLETPLVARIAASAAAPSQARYFILAIFRDRADAVHAARTVRALPTRVGETVAQGRLIYRVLAGPVPDGADEASFRARVAGAGLTDVRTVALCRDTLNDPPCPPPEIGIGAGG